MHVNRHWGGGGAHLSACHTQWLLFLFKIFKLPSLKYSVILYFLIIIKSNWHMLWPLDKCLLFTTTYGYVLQKNLWVLMSRVGPRPRTARQVELQLFFGHRGGSMLSLRRNVCLGTRWWSYYIANLGWRLNTRIPTLNITAPSYWLNCSEEQ